MCVCLRACVPVCECVCVRACVCVHEFARDIYSIRTGAGCKVLLNMYREYKINSRRRYTVYTISPVVSLDTNRVASFTS